MEALPRDPTQQPLLVTGSADVTVGPKQGPRPGEKVEKGAHKARLIFPRSKDPRFHVAVTKVPAVVDFGTLCARGASLFTWLFTKTETMMVPDPKNAGQFVKVYVSLESLRKRVHIPETQARAAFREDRQTLTDGGAARVVRDLINSRAEARAKGVEDFITLYCQADESGMLTVKDTRQSLGLTAKDLSSAVETASTIDRGGKTSTQFTVNGKQGDRTIVVAQEPGGALELYVIPDKAGIPTLLQDSSRIPVRNILSPSTQRTYTIYSDKERESQMIEASALKSGGEPPIEVTKDKTGLIGGKTVVGHLEVAYTETAEGLMHASPQEKLRAFKDGLGSTLSSLAGRHATRNVQDGYRHLAIDRSHLVNSNGQWKLLGGTAAAIQRPNYPSMQKGAADQKQDVAALAKSWAQVITGQESPAMDGTLSTAFTNAGATSEEAAQWARLLRDMSKGNLTAVQARDRATAILTPTVVPQVGKPTPAGISTTVTTSPKRKEALAVEAPTASFNGEAFEEALQMCTKQINQTVPEQTTLRKSLSDLEKQLRLANNNTELTSARSRKLRLLLSKLQLPNTAKFKDPGATASAQEQYTYFENTLQYFSTPQGLSNTLPQIVKKNRTTKTT